MIFLSKFSDSMLVLEVYIQHHSNHSSHENNFTNVRMHAAASKGQQVILFWTKVYIVRYLVLKIQRKVENNQSNSNQLVMLNHVISRLRL